VVATGRFEAGSDQFVAEEILAKHDENYQPRELEDVERPAASASY
jgi:cytochrome c-type biogenesis protein CcmE